MSESIIFTHAKVFNGESVLPGLQHVWVQDGAIQSITLEIPKNTSAKEINLQGKTLMPGLIDAHIHATAAPQVDLAQHGIMDSYIWVKSGASLEDMLSRGFTTVRDAGGLDGGIARISKEGWIKAPRVFPSGKALSQTNGHGDFRSGHNHFGSSFEPCACSLASNSSISMICDGVSGVRKATREQLRLGATQIKIMASGGIASPKDRVDALQFSDEEIAAIVDEANRAHTYVMAHAYTPEAIKRCARLGVRSIEHGNLLDKTSAEIMAEYDMFLVPTLAIYDALFEKGADYGAPASTIKKLEEVRAQGLDAIQLAKQAGIKVGFGTDLLGELQTFQSREFILRSAIESPIDTLRAATSINADLLMKKGILGCIREQAAADILVIDGNPLEDISLMTQTESLVVIMKEGKLMKNLLI